MFRKMPMEKLLAGITFFALPVYAYLLLNICNSMQAAKFDGFRLYRASGLKLERIDLYELSPQEEAVLERQIDDINNVSNMLGFRIRSSDLFFGDGIESDRNSLLAEAIAHELELRLPHLLNNRATLHFLAALFSGLALPPISGVSQPWRILLRVLGDKEMPDDMANNFARDVLPKNMGPINRVRTARELLSFARTVQSSRPLAPIEFWRGFVQQEQDPAFAQRVRELDIGIDGQALISRIKRPIEAYLFNSRLVHFMDKVSKSILPTQLGITSDQPQLPIQKLFVKTCAVPLAAELWQAVAQSQFEPQQLILVQDCGDPKFVQSVLLNWSLFDFAIRSGKFNAKHRIYQVPDWAFINKNQI